MSWANTFTAATGIGSGISAMCFFATLFFQNANRKEERSVADIIGNTGLQLKPSDVINIIKEFKDDETRKEVLHTILKLQRDQAELLMEKLKSGIDLDKLAQHQDTGKVKMLKLVSGPATILFLVMFGLGAVNNDSLKLALPSQTTFSPEAEKALAQDFAKPIVAQNANLARVDLASLITSSYDPKDSFAAAAQMVLQSFGVKTTKDEILERCDFSSPQVLFYNQVKGLAGDWHKENGTPISLELLIYDSTGGPMGTQPMNNSDIIASIRSGHPTVGCWPAYSLAMTSLQWDNNGVFTGGLAIDPRLTQGNPRPLDWNTERTPVWALMFREK